MSGKWHGGKGSTPRPFSVSPEEFGDRFDTIFGKKKKTEVEKFDESVVKNEYYDLDIDSSGPDKDK
jgi:hypothetical protein